MDTIGIARQIIAFQKAAFDNTYSAMALFQAQSETAASNLLGQAPGLPETGKAAINSWIAACKKGRQDFKNLVDANFEMVGGFFNETDPSAASK